MMKRSMFALGILGVVLATGTLLGQNVQEPPPTARLATVALPPQLDRILRNYERAWRAGDAAALAALFAQDGFVLQSNRPPVRGRAAIRSPYDATYNGRGGGPLQLRALAYSTGDKIGYIIGAYSYANNPGDTEKFTLILHRALGERWLIFSDMDNLNATPQRLKQRAMMPAAFQTVTNADPVWATRGHKANVATQATAGISIHAAIPPRSMRMGIRRAIGLCQVHDACADA